MRRKEVKKCCIFAKNLSRWKKETKTTQDRVEWATTKSPPSEEAAVFLTKAKVKEDVLIKNLTKKTATKREEVFVGQEIRKKRID